MKTHIGLLSMLLSPGMFAVAQDSWVQKADFGGAGRFYAAGFGIANKIYIGTGYTQSYYHYGYSDDFWEYDPVTDVWTQKAHFYGEGRCYAAAFSIGDKGYMGTGEYWNGGGNVYFKDFYEYDPIENRWIPKAAFPGEVRSEAIGFTANGKGYIGLGTSNTGMKDDIWEYDPATNQWVKATVFPGSKRTGCFAFSLGNKAYIGLGWNGTLTTDVWQYNPALNIWQQKNNFPGEGRIDPVSFSIGERAYMATGFSSTELNDFWQYNAASDQWTSLTAFPGNPRDGAVGLSLNGHGYLGTGNDRGYAKDFWQYTPSIAVQDTCATPYALQTIHVADTAVLLGWSLPADTVNGYRIRCEAVYINDVHKRTVASNTSRVLIHGLLPGTTYKWKMKSFCAADTAAWIIGPAFTTKRVQSFSANTSNDLHTATNVVSVTPNPCNGNFIVTLHLPQQIQQAEVCLYSAAGIKIWQQKAVPVAGLLTAGINLAGNVVPGVYMLKINHINGSVKCQVVVE